MYTGSYFVGYETSALVKTQNELIVGGNIPEIYRITGTSIKKWDSSSKCTLSLKENNGLVYGCGTSNFVDIFNSTARVCSLIAS